MEIILASGSPRRREILQGVGAAFKIMISDAEEIIDASLPPYFTAEKLSLLKASDIASKLSAEGKEAVVIGADTIVVKDGEILTKPKDKDDAIRMLTLLSGKSHEVITGVTVIDTKTAKSESFYESTKVYFKKLTEDEILAYTETTEPYDKAGSYAIQGKGALLIEKIEGDYFNVVGLPVCRLSCVLKEEFNIKL